MRPSREASAMKASIARVSFTLLPCLFGRCRRRVAEGFSEAAEVCARALEVLAVAHLGGEEPGVRLLQLRAQAVVLGACIVPFAQQALFVAAGPAQQFATAARGRGDGGAACVHSDVAAITVGAPADVAGERALVLR